MTTCALWIIKGVAFALALLFGLFMWGWLIPTYLRWIF